VRVNDRGPFIDNRLIDLSYTAALKLDLVGAGTGLVEVTAISVDEPLPNRASPTTAAAAKSDVDLFVQVGAFGDQENARRRLRMLRSNGFKQSFVFTDRQSQATRYRVRIGPIEDVAEFDRIIEKLRDVGIEETHLVAD
jgi:rare lipoprotein A